MFKKNCDIFLKIALVLLLVTGFWIVIEGIFNSSTIGTFTDWLSATSTFLTLVVAYMAYKAAPKWISQKIGESALTNATQVLTVEIPKIPLVIAPFYRDISTALDLYESFEDTEISEGILANFIDEYSANKFNVNDLDILLSSIQLQFNALGKMGWELTYGAEEKYENLEKSALLLLSSFLKLNRIIEVYIQLNIDLRPNSSQNMLKTIIAYLRNIRSIHTEFVDIYNCFDGFQNYIPDYFKHNIK